MCSGFVVLLSLLRRGFLLWCSGFPLFLALPLVVFAPGAFALGLPPFYLSLVSFWVACMESLCLLLVIIFLFPTFVLPPVNLCGICFLIVLSLSAFCLGFSPFSFACHRCPLLSWFVRSLFGFSSDELRVVPRVFVCLLNVCKFCIWWARNDFRFRSVRPSAIDVMDRVKARLRFHLPLFFRRFSSDRRRRFIVRQWGTRVYIASIVDGRLVIHI